jgi:hypothetical protein
MSYGILLADREPADNLTLPTDLDEADAQNVPLTDRDGNRYTGRLVFHAHTWTEASNYIRQAYTSGSLPTGEAVPINGLVAVELKRHPRQPAPLKFAPNH